MKKSTVFLRMTENTGTHPMDTSDESYELGKDSLDIVYPINGGKLKGDGTWLQEGWLINHDFPQNLRQMAIDNGQQYIPLVNSRSYMELNQVLESTALQEKAANNLAILATTRFDSPWDGVALNLEGTAVENEDAMSDFLYILDQRLHTAGLTIEVSLGGKVEDDDTIFTTLDFSVIGQIADIVELCVFSYSGPLPISIAPHWYIEKCIQYALANGIPNERIILCLGTYAKHWPNTFSNQFKSLTYQQAVEKAAGHPSNWIERNQHGLVREIKAMLPDGFIWYHDADTHQHRLDLIDKYDLAGVGQFIAGCEDPAVWPLIKAWK